MKNTQKVTRLKLDTSHVNDLTLIGLVSSEPDYKLSLSLNKKFGISLKNVAPVTISEEPGNNLVFSRFSDTGRYPELTFTLISNRSGKKFLLKNLKNIDFIFQIHDSESEIDINQFAGNLRVTEFISAIFIVDLNTFKDKNLHYLTL